MRKGRPLAATRERPDRTSQVRPLTAGVGETQLRFQTKRSNSNRTNADRIIQNIPPMPRAPRNFMDPRQLPGMGHLTASDGLTIVMAPVRHIPGVDSAPTQQLPPVAEELPPSARHVDPRAWHDRTHVEDNDLEPETPGRHALNELLAAPDDIRNLANVAQRVIDDLGGPDTAAKNPALNLAVRMFRHARDMSRAREARCAQDDARLAAVDARIKAFAERWAHDDAHWDRVAQALKAKQEASDAGQLIQAYDAEGTAAALYKVDELSQVIVQRALAGSAVSA